MCEGVERVGEPTVGGAMNHQREPEVRIKGVNRTYQSSVPLLAAMPCP